MRHIYRGNIKQSERNGEIYEEQKKDRDCDGRFRQTDNNETESVSEKWSWANNIFADIKLSKTFLVH